MDGTRHAAILKGEYWKEKVVKLVFFTTTTELTCASTLPGDVALEVGPRAALKGPVSQTVKQTTSTLLPYHGTVAQDKHDMETLSETLGFFWASLGREAVDFVG